MMVVWVVKEQLPTETLTSLNMCPMPLLLNCLSCLQSFSFFAGEDAYKQMVVVEYFDDKEKSVIL